MFISYFSWVKVSPHNFKIDQIMYKIYKPNIQPSESSKKNSMEVFLLGHTVLFNS